VFQATMAGTGKVSRLGAGSFYRMVESGFARLQSSIGRETGEPFMTGYSTRLSRKAIWLYSRVTPSKFWTGEGYFGTRGTFFADVDGDGKADAIVVNDNGITVRLSQGDNFGPSKFWIGEPMRCFPGPLLIFLRFTSFSKPQ
jgi:hypothetical protein